MLTFKNTNETSINKGQTYPTPFGPFPVITMASLSVCTVLDIVPLQGV